jgi:hypothetical protein
VLGVEAEEFLALAMEMPVLVEHREVTGAWLRAAVSHGANGNQRA